MYNCNYLYYIYNHFSCRNYFQYCTILQCIFAGQVNESVCLSVFLSVNGSAYSPVSSVGVSFSFINWDGWRCWWTDFVPGAIHNPVAIKLLVSGLLT